MDISEYRQLGIPLTGYQGAIAGLTFTPDNSALISVDATGKLLSRSIVPS
ncbi:hypothetical protein J4573_02270 [Actinomadura barringtoniae]|uniref:WD40 repeat domain-containing protein n=1 Tax=Actinomadura barringtoniae TaxID=1427535 RepID=A0A939PAA9_9ACTN|nr:hypothetical protein [Actinomadura barringtoniae]MBO2445904.1 hypothetical protein [Actinomadura barringtoniae]